MKRELLFDEDPITKTREWFVMEDGADSFQIVTEQIVDPICEENQENFKQFDERAPWKGDGFHRVAGIPANVVADLMRKGILLDPKAMKRWLNDPENRKYRTRPGRV